jgi:hypothetical protein
MGMETLTKCFSTLNIFTLFTLFFMMNHGIGVPFAFGLNDALDLDLPDDVIIRWLASLVIMYVCFLLGIVIAKYFFGNRQISR